MAEYSVEILLRLQDQLSAGLRQAEAALNGFRSNVEKSIGSMKSSWSRLGDVVKTTLGVVFGVSLAGVLNNVRRFVEDSVHSFVEFERESQKLAALAAQAGQDVGELAQAFRVVAASASREFGVSANQALQALESLVKAGLTGRDAVDALGSAIMMAKIEGLDFGTAANSLVQVMAQFALSGNEAARAVDVLVNASRMGIGSAYDFAQGLANVGATARTLGLSLEETTTYLVMLEKQLGSAEAAGTLLNRLFINLANIARNLGIATQNADGSMRNMNNVIAEVLQSLRNMIASGQDVSQVFVGIDERARRAALMLAQTRDSFDDLVTGIEKAGTAWEVFAEVMNTTSGQTEKMQADVDAMQRRIGEFFSNIAVNLKRVFLPAVEAVFTAWSGIIAGATGDTVSNLESWLNAQRLLGRMTEEEMGNMIKAWVDAGTITREQALKMAENLGVMKGGIGELVMEAISAGENVPESFRKIADMVAATVDESVQKMTQLQNTIAGLKAESEAFSSAASLFDMQIKLVTAGLGEKATKIEAVKNQLDKWRASQERLNAIMSVFNYLQAQARIQLLVLELAEKGLTEQSQNLGETLDMLNQIMADGKISSQEYESMLKALANRFPELRAVIEPVLKLLHDFGAGEDVAKQVDEQRRAMDAKAKSVDTLAATIQAYQAVEQRLGFLTQQINTALQVRKALYLEVGDAIDVLSQAENRNFEKTDEWMQQAYQAIDLLVQEGFLTRDQAAALNGLIPVMDTSNDMRERWNNLLAEAVERYKELTSLTREEQITLERLNAISSVLGLTQQALQLQQQALTLEMLGQSEAAEKLRGAFNRIGDAMQDGYIDAKEFQNILKELQYTPFELQFDFTGLEQGFTNLATSIETNMTTAVTNIVTTLQSQVTPALSTMAQTFSQTLNESILPVFTTWEERLSIIQSWYNTYIPSAIQTTATKITELQTKTQEEIVKVGELQTVITAMKDSAVNNIAAIMLQLGNMVQKVDAVARAFSPGVTSSIGEAEKAVQSLASAINSLPSEKTITINIVERRTTVSDEGGAGGGAPTAQHGAWFTHEGLYYLHRGEMVLPRPVAEWFREGSMPVGKTVNVNVNMNIAAASAETDWRRVAEIISREINRNLRAM